MDDPESDATIIHSIALSGNTASYANIIAWSEENILAFATEDCIIVLEPSIYSVGTDGYLAHSIHRHVIPSCKEVNQFNFEADRNEMHLKLPRNEMFSLMLDRTLSPAVACGPSYKGCRQIVWSSAGVATQGTCVLAALTMDHRLTLSVYRDQTFVEVVAVSQMWFDYLSSVNFQLPLVMNRSEHLFQDPSMQKLHHESYATSAAKIVWSHLIKTVGCSETDPDFVQESFAYLIVGLKNGVVVLWKAMAFLESCNDMLVEHYFDTCVGLISALHWVEIDSNTGLLIVGSKFGEIHYYTVTADPSNSYHAVVAKGETLWGERDRLEVSHISSLKDFDDQVYVLAGKGSFLVAWCISNGEVRRFHTVGDFLQPLTGIVSDTDSFLATTGDGTLLRISVNKATEGLTLSINHVMKDKEDPNLTYMGIAMSHNKVLFCLVQQIGSWFDHLAIREPNKLLIVTSKSADEALSVILEISESNVLLSTISDILLHLYYSLLKQKQLPSNLTTLVEFSEEQLRIQPVVKLQLLRWLLRLVQFGEHNSDSILKYKMQGELVNKFLIKHQLLQLLKTIDLPHAESLLGIKWASILAVMCNWLTTGTGDGEETDQEDINNVLNFLVMTSGMRKEQLQMEECRLCKQNLLIPLDDIHFGKCSNGHTFGRCCLSLTICDRPTYKRCRNCFVCAEQHICDLYENPRCPFCSLALC